MKPKPTVHAICGFIGAGKTTFARQLEASSGAVRITKDEWLIRLIGRDPTIDGYAEIDRKMCELTRDFAFQLVEKGIDIILDEGFWAREERGALRERVAASGASMVMYYLATPNEVIRERVASRNVIPSLDSFRIDRDLLEHYLAFWQPPGPDEDVVIVNDLSTR